MAIGGAHESSNSTHCDFAAAFAAHCRGCGPAAGGSPACPPLGSSSGHWCGPAVQTGQRFGLLAAAANEFSRRRIERPGTGALRITARLKQVLKRIASPREAHGAEIIDIAKLISPLRYDVIARKDFFDFASAERSLYYTNRERFRLLARERLYYDWFEKVCCARFQPTLLRDRAKLADAFCKKIDRSMRLYESFQANGFLPANKIVLRSGRQILESDSGKLVSQRVFAGDGCHRLALLLHNGINLLQPDWHVIATAPRYTPVDNTILLLARAGLTEKAYAQFISASFESFCNSVEDLKAHVAQSAPHRIDELDGILQRDLPLLGIAAEERA